MEPQSFPVTDAFRGMRLDRFLQAMLPRMSRSSIQDAIGERVSLASGLEPRPSRRLAVGDVVTIRPRPSTTSAAIEVPVLLDREAWLVVDKPAGLGTTPTARRPGADLATLTGASPAHRLDRFTSGCLVLTRTAGAARFFDAAFRERRVRKEYVALVEGSPSRESFEVDAPLARDETSRVPGRMRADAAGATALTHVEVIARLEATTLVRARLVTGRRHQIRVHLAHAGHPIVGDLLYGGDERRFVRFQLGQSVESGRHLLHASQLAFEDECGAPIVVGAPWPADFPELRTRT